MASQVTSTRPPKPTKAPRAKTSVPAASSHAISNLAQWKLEDAKARFSEVVRRASKMPQLVTVRGREAAVILAPEDYRRLVVQPEALSFTDFLATLDLGGIDLEREPDRGRDFDFWKSNGESDR
jgi:prevent-host-death family protein